VSAESEYAVTFTAQEHAQLLPVERDPTPLKPDEVLGRTLVTLVSPGTELASGYLGAKFPRVPGYAAVFAVEEVGSDVTDFAAGAPAFCMGSHRSFQRLKREDVLPVPDGLSPERAVFARLMSVTMSTLTTTTARPSAKVVVTGLGIVGNLGAQVFQASGYEVTACDPVESRRETARQMGIRNVLPAVPGDGPGVAGKVALVLECSGHEQAAVDGCKVVGRRGEGVLVGTPWRRRTDLSAHELLHAVFHNYVVLRSGWEWELPRQPTAFRTGSIFANLGAALGWLAEGRVRVDGLYSKVPPREAQQAYQDLLHMRGKHLTAVFDWTDCP